MSTVQLVVQEQGLAKVTSGALELPIRDGVTGQLQVDARPDEGVRLVDQPLVKLGDVVGHSGQVHTHMIRKNHKRGKRLATIRCQEGVRAAAGRGRGARAVQATL